jgi:hypothetical protein
MARHPDRFTPPTRRWHHCHPRASSWTALLGVFSVGFMSRRSPIFCGFCPQRMKAAESQTRKQDKKVRSGGSGAASVAQIGPESALTRSSVPAGQLRRRSPGGSRTPTSSSSTRLLPFSASGGASLFHLLSKLRKRDLTAASRYAAIACQLANSDAIRPGIPI